MPLACASTAANGSAHIEVVSGEDSAVRSDQVYGTPLLPATARLRV